MWKAGVPRCTPLECHNKNVLTDSLARRQLLAYVQELNSGDLFLVVSFYHLLQVRIWKNEVRQYLSWQAQVSSCAYDVDSGPRECEILQGGNKEWPRLCREGENDKFIQRSSMMSYLFWEQLATLVNYIQEWAWRLFWLTKELISFASKLPLFYRGAYWLFRKPDKFLLLQVHRQIESVSIRHDLAIVHYISLICLDFNVFTVGSRALKLADSMPDRKDTYDLDSSLSR